FPLIVLGAGALGYLAARLGGGSLFVAADRSSPTENDNPVANCMCAEGVPDHVRASPGRTLGVLAIWLPLWLGPVALLLLWLGGDHVFAQIGLFFIKIAVVTCGWGCAGALAAALTWWVPCAPCFLWIFLGAPYVERLRANRALAAALSAITAAVV